MAASKRWPCSFMIVISFMVLVSPGLLVVPHHQSVDRTTPADRVAVVAATDYAYRNYSEVRARLLEIESQHPAIARVLDIGDSWEKTQGIADRDILALKISDNVTVDEAEPEVLITALHHAREWISSEVAVALAERLTLDYGTDPRVSWLVDNREVWIVPVVNPDGLDYALAADDMWRKNRHLNADFTYGVDLNRNYDGSSNGDPLGVWGGAGSSNLTSSEVYCGTGPFSEPETKAVRDLVLTRNFTIAIDFHSFGDLVLWPWGYTADQTADHADLSRIGTELAAVNGYTAEQSVGLYPTTGDSIDWMYGHEGIFAFAVEVGAEFHPANASVVAESISLNVDSSLTAVEIAGDRNEKGFTIAHTPMISANFTELGHAMTANVTADRGVDSSTVTLAYTLDGVNWTRLPMAKAGGNDTYSASLPSLPVWQIVEYYFSAVDNGGIYKAAPDYAPYETYTLVISPPTELIGGVDFDIPPEIDGTVGYKFNASVSGYPEGFWLDLRLNGTHHSYSYRWTMETGTGTLTCEIEAGIALDNYFVRLAASLGGFEIWSSPVFPLRVVDETPPTFSGMDGSVAIADTGRRYTVVIGCSDLYGADEAVLQYRINGGQSQTLTYDPSAAQTNPSVSPGTPKTYSWRMLFPIPDEEGYLEYRLFVNDTSKNSAAYPSADSWTRVDFGPSNVSPGSNVFYLAFAMTAAVAAVVVVLLLIRARRRRASGLEGTRSRSPPKKP